MKVYHKLICAIITSASLVFSCSSAEDSLVSVHQEDSIRALTQRVILWQEANPNYINDGKYGWGTATYYIGLMSAYRATLDVRYLDICKTWATNNQWKLKSSTRDADDHAAGQVFLEVYQHESFSEYIEDVRNVMDSIVLIPKAGRQEWYWVDALFMSPPVLAKLGQITEDPIYHQTLHSMWWDAVDYFLDEEDSLFYRDRNFFDRTNVNGNKIFWSRGNGWALGGLVRTHQALAIDDPRRSDYEELLRLVSKRLISTQNEFGLWYPNIIDPLSYPYKETSGSSLILYALTYGYNQGILGKEYLETITAAWTGLANLVDSDGRLLWVQASAGGPTEVYEQDVFMYGTGAFLLAASEIIKMND